MKNLRIRGVTSFLVQWRGLQDLDCDWDTAELVGATIRLEAQEDQEKHVVLSEKYSDFSDVFDKANAGPISCALATRFSDRFK